MTARRLAATTAADRAFLPTEPGRIGRGSEEGHSGQASLDTSGRCRGATRPAPPCLGGASAGSLRRRGPRRFVLGGAVCYASRYEARTRSGFRFLLPLMAVDRDRLKNARILIADDEEAQLELLSQALRPGGYEHIATTSDPTRVLKLCREGPADLLLLDVRMPAMDGFAVLEQLESELADFHRLPVVVLTTDDSRQTKKRVFDRGASDFLAKPVSPAELRLRVDNHLERRFLHQDVQRQNERLEERIRERTADLRAAQVEILDKLAVSAEYRDDETGQHTRRVGWLAARVADRLGWDEKRVRRLRHAAPLHDIGKIGVPDRILQKEGTLTEEEMAVMERHTVIGADILTGSQFPILQMGQTIARAHHERWDGEGYPDGRAGREIPLEARIVQAVDVFDSLTHERRYKKAWSVGRAAEYLRQGRGAEFDPDVAEALLSVDLERVVAEDIEFSRPLKSASSLP